MNSTYRDSLAAPLSRGAFGPEMGLLGAVRMTAADGIVPGAAAAPLMWSVSGWNLAESS